MKLIKSFDTWNRLYEASQSPKKGSGVRSINEKEDMFTKIMEGIKSSMAYTKAIGMMKKWAELSKTANEQIMALAVKQKAAALGKQLDGLANSKAKVKGAENKANVQQKIDKVNDAIAKITEYADEQKQQAANEKEAFKETLDDLQKQMKEPFADLYAKQLSEINRTVLLEAAKAKGQIAAIDGNEKKAEAAKKEELQYTAQLDKLKKDLIDGKELAFDDLEELDELKPYIADIQNVQAEKIKLDNAIKNIDGDNPSSVETAAGDDAAKQQTALEGLKTKIAAKQTAQEALWDEKEKLYKKVKSDSAGVTKTVISLAGGDPEKATKVDDKWKIADLNSTWAAPNNSTEFIPKDEYTKSTKAVIADIDSKIAALTPAGTPQP